MVKGSNRGFTLIEITIAFLIIVVAVFAALDLFVQSKRYQSRAWDINTASFAAAAVLEQIKRVPYEQVVSVPRSIHPEYPSFYYCVDVSPGVFENMKTVTVSVFYKSGGEEKRLSLSMEKLNR